MVPITALWLPIILSAVLVFVASSVLHMILSYHKSEYRKLPDEEAVRLSAGENIVPGFYAFPHVNGPQDLKNPEVLEKFKRGPVGYLTIIPKGGPSMGKYLGLWFSYCLLIAIFVAYLTGRTISSETQYMPVFRIAGTIAFLGYGVGHIVDSIWRGQPWSATIKHVFDGMIYALLTAGTFAWLWPR